MNYNTLVTPDEGLACTQEEAAAIVAALSPRTCPLCEKAKPAHQPVCFECATNTKVMASKAGKAAVRDHEPDEEPEEESMHGFQFNYEGGDGYLVAEENGNWAELPVPALKKIGALLTKVGKPHWEFGVAFTAGRLVAGSCGGTAFRILADGTVVERAELWGPSAREAALAKAVTEYLEWGAMTGSDRDLHERAFKAALEVK